MLKIHQHSSILFFGWWHLSLLLTFEILHYTIIFATPVALKIEFHCASNPPVIELDYDLQK